MEKDVLNLDASVKNVKLCPRCGTVDGDLSVVGVDGQPVKIECYDEHHDDQDDLEGLAAREDGVQVDGWQPIPEPVKNLIDAQYGDGPRD